MASETFSIRKLKPPNVATVLGIELRTAGHDTSFINFIVTIAATF